MMPIQRRMPTISRRQLHGRLSALAAEHGPFQPCMTAEGAEQVARAEAWRDALLRRDLWCGFIAPEVP